MYDQNLRTRMATMPPQQLKQFAMMHKDDPFVVSMAVDIDNTRKAAQRQQAMQAAQQPQPKVVDQNLAAIGQPDMPPQGMAQPQLQQPLQAAPQMQAGLPQVPAQNIANMADGGIAGYAEGDVVRGGREEYRSYAMQKAQEMGLDPSFVDGIFKTESNYNAKAKSKTGPQGIGQLTSFIAKRFGISPKDRLDPYKNMDASLGFMDYLNKKYKGDKAKMAVAYNQGEGVLNEHLKQNNGKLIPENLHQNVKTANKDEPLNYLKKMTAAGAITPPATQTAEAGTREAPRTPEMLARQKEAIRRRQLAEALPIGEARAAEDKAKAGEFFPANMLNPDIGKPKPIPAVPQGEPTGAQQIAAIEQRLPIAEIMRREQAEAAARKKAEAGKLPKPVREALGAPEAAASFLSGAVAPATALLPFGLSKFTDKPLTYEQAMDAATFAPRTEVGKESLSGLYQAVDDYKIPPYIPGIGAPRRAPAKGQAARTAALATEAELAAAKAKTAAPRLTGPEPKVAEPNFAADVAAAARARAPKTPLMQEIEQARALEKGRQEFSVAPETAALGDEALARRRAVEQAQADLRNKAANERVPGLAETPAEKLTPEQALEADKARTAELEQKLLGDQARASELGFEDLRAREDMRAKAVVNDRYNAGRNLAGGAAGAAVRGPGEVAPDEYAAYSDEPGYNFRDATGGEKTGEVPIEERGTTATPENKTGFGSLSDEDWMMLGLNMLQAPAGQSGNALSQLAQNIGRSGLATLGAKKTREQQAIDNLYKQAHGEYFKQMGTEAAAKADYYKDQKSEVALRTKVLDAVSDGMKSWNQANFGATPQEEQAQRMRLFDYYSQQLGLTPLAPRNAGASSGFRVLD